MLHRILEIRRYLVQSPLCTIHLLVDCFLTLRNFKFDVIQRNTSIAIILGLVVLTRIP